MKRFTLLLFALSFVIISCKSNDNQIKEAKEFNQKMEQTIAIHDEVMPKMSKINQLLSQLEVQIDSTNRMQIEPVMENLQSGHDEMMNWMKSFGDEFSKTEINQGIQLKSVDSIKQRLRTLEKSYQNAQEMKKQILGAIKKANTLLEKES